MSMAHILNPLLSIKVLLKAACSQSEGLYATFRGTFIDKRGFRIWANEFSLLTSNLSSVIEIFTENTTNVGYVSVLAWDSLTFHAIRAPALAGVGKLRAGVKDVHRFRGFQIVYILEKIFVSLQMKTPNHLWQVALTDRGIRIRLARNGW